MRDQCCVIPTKAGIQTDERLVSKQRRQIVAALGGCLLLSRAALATPIGQAIAIPSTALIEGTVIKPEHWKGKVLIIERFATWCPFCKVQNPKLEKLLRTHKTKGLEVLALSIDKNPGDVPKYMRQHGYTFNTAMMTPGWEQVLGDVKGLPVTWVIGRDGKLKQVEAGELLDEDVAELARWL